MSDPAKRLAGILGVLNDFGLLAKGMEPYQIDRVLANKEAEVARLRKQVAEAESLLTEAHLRNAREQDEHSAERAESLRDAPSWAQKPPQGRKFALCVILEGSVPKVLQWEPTLGIWSGGGNTYLAGEVVWHPLPKHKLFNSKTHVLPNARVPKSYFLDQDNSSHWYLVEAYKRAEWEEWLNLDEDDPKSWEAPSFAKGIDSPSTVTFEQPSLKD